MASSLSLLRYPYVVSRRRLLCLIALLCAGPPSPTLVVARWNSEKDVSPWAAGTESKPDGENVGAGTGFEFEPHSVRPLTPARESSNTRADANPQSPGNLGKPDTADTLSKSQQQPFPSRDRARLPRFPMWDSDPSLLDDLNFFFEPEGPGGQVMLGVPEAIDTFEAGDGDGREEQGHLDRGASFPGVVASVATVRWDPPPLVPAWLDDPREPAGRGLTRFRLTRNLLSSVAAPGTMLHYTEPLAKASISPPVSVQGKRWRRVEPSLGGSASRGANRRPEEQEAAANRGGVAGRGWMTTSLLFPFEGPDMSPAPGGKNSSESVDKAAMPVRAADARKTRGTKPRGTKRQKRLGTKEAYLLRFLNKKLRSSIHARNTTLIGLALLSGLAFFHLEPPDERIARLEARKLTGPAESLLRSFLSQDIKPTPPP